jgi:hypothetical protein
MGLDETIDVLWFGLRLCPPARPGRREAPRGAVFEAQGMKVSLASRFPLAREGDGVAAEFVLNRGDTTTLILCQVESSHWPLFCAELPFGERKGNGRNPPEGEVPNLKNGGH